MDPVTSAARSAAASANSSAGLIATVAPWLSLSRESSESSRNRLHEASKASNQYHSRFVASSICASCSVVSVPVRPQISNFIIVLVTDHVTGRRRRADRRRRDRRSRRRCVDRRRAAFFSVVGVVGIVRAAVVGVVRAAVVGVVFGAVVVASW